MSKLQVIKQRQDQERRKLIELREALKSTLTTYKEVGGRALRELFETETIYMYTVFQKNVHYLKI